MTKVDIKKPPYPTISLEHISYSRLKYGITSDVIWREYIDSYYRIRECIIRECRI